MRIEEWENVKDFEGLYQISNYGRVKSLPRNTAHERIMKLRKDRFGYIIVNLTKNGKAYTKKVHRLVAQAFIPNLENKYSVNHINGDKSDNRVENLEWATSSEQIKHAYKIGLLKWDCESKNKLKNTLKQKGLELLKEENTHTKGHKFGYVKVVQKDDFGNIIKIYDSMSDVERELGIPVPHIVRVCKGIRKHTRGYIWEYYKGGDE